MPVNINPYFDSVQQVYVKSKSCDLLDCNQSLIIFQFQQKIS